ncbi:hypothetical protein [Kitasatospora cheerisanensis]|uniref:hypothetical protein n=1 Tax=Kitasatospora cheerisanensis TaxID=81942 RepID=UPI000A82D8DD|nr:hypothetical protein [Kitasatospora cheerisanensis]
MAAGVPVAGPVLPAGPLHLDDPSAMQLPLGVGLGMIGLGLGLVGMKLRRR